jgi:hypothetical protein
MYVIESEQMSLPIYVDAYSGYRANERPRLFHVDEDMFDIESVEDRWFDPNAEYFKVRTTEGKRYLLRYDLTSDEWTLQSGFDGDELLTRPSIALVTVSDEAIREAELRIEGCEQCRPKEAHIPFDFVLEDVLDKRGAFEFVLTGTARCPRCSAQLSEKTRVEPAGGIESGVAVGG